MVPGDDIQIALEIGMVNEVVPREKIYARAREIADQLMKSASRVTRRVTVQILRAP